MAPQRYKRNIIIANQKNYIINIVEIVKKIGVFVLNGESFIKKMGKGCLISLNPAYSPIQLREFDSVRCAGKVIGTINLN